MGTAASVHAVDHLDKRMQEILSDNSCLAELAQRCQTVVLTDASLQKALAHINDSTDLKDGAGHALTFLQERGLGCARDDAAAACVLVPGEAASLVHTTRQTTLQSLGAHAAAADWDGHLAACGGLHGLRQADSCQQEDAHLAGSRGAGGSGCDGWGSVMSSGCDGSLGVALQGGCSALR